MHTYIKREMQIDRKTKAKTTNKQSIRLIEKQTYIMRPITIQTKHIAIKRNKISFNIDRRHKTFE